MAALSKYKTYPEYKDSGVEWLGEIPSHWVNSRLKYLAPFQVGWTPPTKKNDNFIGNNPWANISDLKEKIITNTKNLISNNAIKESSIPHIPKGSLLYSFKLSVGLVAFAGIDLYSNEAIASFQTNTKLPLSYLYYALPIFVIENASTNIYGAKILNQELIRNSTLINIQYYEAEKIAQFLDHETAKIDQLIEKQQSLIELLKEKRQAVISHAVTKGLDPNVKMKDSGVEWLGEVSEHWKVTRLKRIISSLDSGCSVNAADIPASDGEVGVLKTSCVYTRKFRVEENKTVISEDLHRVKCPIKKDAIIISRMNTPELVGASALVTAENPLIYLPDRLWQTNFYHDIQINSKYLAEFMSILPFREQITLVAEGASSSMQNITKENYLSIYCLLPNISEQEKIINFLDIQTSKIDLLTHKAEEQIELMKERRTALISAAVTGKIDVRDWQPEQ